MITAGRRRRMKIHLATTKFVVLLGVIIASNLVKISIGQSIVWQNQPDLVVQASNGYSAFPSNNVNIQEFQFEGEFHQSHVR